jgi:hypothetical protein
MKSSSGQRQLSAGGDHRVKAAHDVFLHRHSGERRNPASSRKSWTLTFVRVTRRERPPSSIVIAITHHVMAVLDTAVFFHAADARITSAQTCFSIVIPANASDPASCAETPKLDPDFRQGDE